MAYMKSYPNQNYLIPPKLTDLFSEDHVSYLIKQITDSLDYSEFDVAYAGAGHPAYHPRIQLKLLLMANIDGMRSSRRIAKNAQENVVYIFLAEKTQPDFRTISDFRKDNKKLVKNAFKHLNLFALKEGLIDLSHLMIDGSMIKADANNDKIIDKKTLEKLEKYVDRVIEEGIKVDEEEDKLYGDRSFHELPENLNDSEKRRPIVRKIVDEINKSMKKGDKENVKQIKAGLQDIKSVMEEKGLKKYSFTDPDARFMLGKKGKIELNYNAQLVVDKNGLIVSNDVVRDCDDRHQLLPNVVRVEQDYGELPKDTKVSADGLYLSEDIVVLDDRKFNLYIPTYGMQKKVKDRFDKVNFEYDEQDDCYTCPEGKILKFRSKTRNKRYGYIITYKCHDCQTCPHQKACCKKVNYRTITALPHEKIVNRIKEKMQTEEGKEVYKLRMQTVEPAFGDLKHNKKFRDFLLRGIEKVKIEFSLACIAHNLVRINNLLRTKGINPTGC